MRVVNFRMVIENLKQGRLKEGANRASAQGFGCNKQTNKQTNTSFKLFIKLIQLKHNNYMLTMQIVRNVLM